MFLNFKKINFSISRAILCLFFITGLSQEARPCSPRPSRTIYKIVGKNLLYGKLFNNGDFDIQSSLSNVDIPSFQAFNGAKRHAFNPNKQSYLDYNDWGSASYFKDKSHIYFGGKVLKNNPPRQDVDIASFRLVGSNTAIDKNYIYFNGVVADDNHGYKKIDVGSFKDFDKNISLDKNNLYHHGEYIGANLDFAVLKSKERRPWSGSCDSIYSDTLYKNKDKIFINGIELNANPNSFAIKRWIVGVLLEYSDKNGERRYLFNNESYDPKEKYSMDGMTKFEEDYNKVYVRGGEDPKGDGYLYYEVEEAHPESFVIVNQNIAYDRDHIFASKTDLSRKVESKPSFKKIKIDSNTFSHVDEYFFKDKKTVYFFTDTKVKKLSKLAPYQFESLRDNLAQDDRHLFYFNVEKNDFQILNIDPNTFTWLGNNFAKDKGKVIYFWDEGFAARYDFDPKTTELVDENLIKSKEGLILKSEDQFYYLKSEGEPPLLINKFYVKFRDSIHYIGPNFPSIKEANPDRFHQIDGAYATDDVHVFYEDELVKSANPASFKVIGNDYAKDSEHVFWKGRPIKDADLQSFELLSETYAADKNTIFVESEALTEADRATFKIIDIPGFACDKNGLYEQSGRVKTLEGTEVSNLLYLGYRYAKNKSKVYYINSYYLSEVDGADPKSFRLLGTNKDKSSVFAKDAHHYYVDQHAVEWIDKEIVPLTQSNDTKPDHF